MGRDGSLRPGRLGHYRHLTDIAPRIPCSPVNRAYLVLVGVDGSRGASESEALLSLHKYFLNADLLRDLFMRHIRARSPESTDLAYFIDLHAMLSLWYASLYVVIEGWETLKISDARLDELLADPLVDDLRVFRNQMFHFQRTYDNPRLLRFLGANDGDAQRATKWARRTHTALGSAIESSLERVAHGARNVRQETE